MKAKITYQFVSSATLKPSFPLTSRMAYPFKGSLSKLFVSYSDWTTRRALILESTIFVSAAFSSSDDTEEIEQVDEER
jgi:hypothetical protein